MSPFATALTPRSTRRGGANRPGRILGKEARKKPIRLGTRWCTHCAYGSVVLSACSAQAAMNRLALNPLLQVTAAPLRGTASREQNR